MVRGGGLMKQAVFNKSLLEFIACPLSKEPLRYCEKSQELVNDAFGMAYPELMMKSVGMHVMEVDFVLPFRLIVDGCPLVKWLATTIWLFPHIVNGVPCLVPARGRILDNCKDNNSDPSCEVTVANKCK